ncbi:acyltransferase [Sphingomonas naphthae]|uniref:Acyltransferase n=1 Tax=Sphingomonas naphthae TaxID=1813468 RepID=A0ABY7TKU5_9SPHN|nr:acyltransferase [Sphingomonas naphthae]WCT73862.1 acyltransferase [Sphingomonas naphthae]
MSIPPSGQPATLRFARIQQLRMIGAILVIAAHAFADGAKYLHAGSRLSILSQTHLGVNLSFVISGFIICYTARGRERDWRLFLRRRLVRVVPLYWLLTILLFAIVMIRPELTKGTNLLSPLLLARSLSFTTFLSGASPLIYVGWTLEYEMLFYLLATLAMSRLERPWHVIPIVMASGVVGIALLDATIGVGMTGIRAITLDFTAGILLAYWFTEGRLPPRPATAVLVGFGVAFAVAVIAGEGLSMAVVPIATALVALAATRDRRGPMRSTVGRLLAAGGGATYSIYLTQVFTVSAMGKLAARFAPGLPLALFALLTVIVTVLAGLLVHRAIEKPLMRLLRPYSSPKPEAVQLSPAQAASSSG